CIVYYCSTYSYFFWVINTSYFYKHLFIESSHRSFVILSFYLSSCSWGNWLCRFFRRRATARSPGIFYDQRFVCLVSHLEIVVNRFSLQNFSEVMVVAVHFDYIIG